MPAPGANTGAHAGGHAASIANAIKASGVLVKVTPEDFQTILERVEEPLVVASPAGIFGKRYAYLTSYRGFAFHTRTKEPLDVAHADVVEAERIWIPS